MTELSAPVSRSYPYLSIARKYDVPHEHVLNYAQLYTSPLLHQPTVWEYASADWLGRWQHDEEGPVWSAFLADVAHAVAFQDHVRAVGLAAAMQGG